MDGLMNGAFSQGLPADWPLRVVEDLEQRLREAELALQAQQARAAELAHQLAEARKLCAGEAPTPALIDGEDF